VPSPGGLAAGRRDLGLCGAGTATLRAASVSTAGRWAHASKMPPEEKKIPQRGVTRRRGRVGAERAHASSKRGLE
jgi:hypothetical protein